MPKAQPYQGYTSWNAWNVSLWIGNDEGLYREAVRLVKKYGIERGARHMAANLAGEKTPDGARYNLTGIRQAMQGMDE
jgi:hypothetical protein